MTGLAAPSRYAVNSPRRDEHHILEWIVESEVVRADRHASLCVLDDLLTQLEDFTLRFGTGVHPSPDLCEAFVGVGGYVPAALLGAVDLSEAVLAMQERLMRRRANGSRASRSVWG